MTVRHTQTFEFAILDNVTIKALNLPGIVTGMQFDGLHPSYRVEYWNNGDRRSNWCLGTELILAV